MKKLLGNVRYQHNSAQKWKGVACRLSYRTLAACPKLSHKPLMRLAEVCGGGLLGTTLLDLFLPGGDLFVLLTLVDSSSSATKIGEECMLFITD